MNNRSMDNRTLYLTGILAIVCTIFCAHTYTSCESETPESLEASSPMESSGTEPVNPDEASAVSNEVLAPDVEQETGVSPDPLPNLLQEDPVLSDPILNEGSMTPAVGTSEPMETISVPLGS